MISGSADGCWKSMDKKAILEFIKPSLYRYFFNEAVPNLHVPLKELGLSDTDINFLKTVHFLLSPEVENLVNELPKLVRNLSHSTQKEVIECRGVVRGRIDWNLTLKERYSQGFNDPSLFICQPATKMYDLPENQLLKFILWKIRSLTENIELSIPDEIIEQEEWRRWVDIIASRYYKVKNISRHIYFQQISLPRIIKPRTLQKAYRHRNQSYDQAADCYELYEKLFITNDQEVLHELIESQIFEPLNNDKLFEIYVLIKILNLLEKISGELEIGLLRPGTNYTARYTSNDLEICIFYQKMPPRFIGCSKNKEIFEYYDPNVSLRRPDILLKFKKEDKTFYRIIEVKRTNERGYIVDSVYKVLGYLNDFEKCLKPTSNPQGVLVIWDGANIKDMNNALKQPVLILQDKNMEKGLLNILETDDTYSTILESVENLLKNVELEYNISPEEVLTLFSRNFMATIKEVKIFMGLISDLTPEDIFITINWIKYPDRSRRFVSQINEVTIRDKDGNVISEPKDWIKFGEKWYDKRELLKN
ncbi:MAG TPA: hypothetical protein GX009_11885 [Candidatus Atribacteria bacterium]|jgi:DNA-binding Lrp family transcriptional regulator|nr:hypothetical protein [Candidatus Atribacteria bacterium]